VALYFKEGVNIRPLVTQAHLAMQVASEVYGDRGFDCVVTSGADGEHRRGSLHYIGHAFDVRTKNLPSLVAKRAVANELVARLKPLGDFDVIFTPPGGPKPEHIHVEYQPKEAA
jgi:hypothetical protein